MELEKIRLELPDKGWAVLYRRVLRKTHRLHTTALIRCLTPVEAAKPQKLSEIQGKLQFGKPPEPTDYTFDPSKINNDEINELFIFNQVVEWSFGPVDFETLENKVTREQYTKLVEEMDRLYQPNPLPGKSGERSSATTSSSPSSNISPSQWWPAKLTTFLNRVVSRVPKS